MNIVTVTFQTCTPAPDDGYRLFWRVQGTEDAYTDAGLFTGSPAQFSDGVNPEGTCYEGYLQSECGSGVGSGNSVPWLTPCESEDSGVINATITRYHTCTSSESTFTIEGVNPGDVIKVRGFYAGLIQKTPGALNAKGALTIFSTAGTYDLSTTPCYSDELPNSFYLTADTEMTIPPATTVAFVTTIAEVFKSIDNFNFLNVAIIEINGTPCYIVAAGCDAATDTEPSC